MSIDSQMELRLPTHGGQRPGAGRKPGPSPRIRHGSRVGIGAAYPLLVTIRVAPGLPSLRRPELVRALEESIAAVRGRRGFRVSQYSLQSNHAHFLIEADDERALGRGMKALGARVSRTVNRSFGRSGRVLVDRYHVQVLRSPKQVRSALAYTLLNRRKHLAQVGGVAALAVDPASSGRWFPHWTTGLAPAPDPPVVSPAKTWLLSTGWLRWGRIDLAETPGH